MSFTVLLPWKIVELCNISRYLSAFNAYTSTPFSSKRRYARAFYGTSTLCRFSILYSTYYKTVILARALFFSHNITTSHLGEKAQINLYFHILLTNKRTKLPNSK